MPVCKIFQCVYCIVLNIYGWSIVYNDDYVPPFCNPFLRIICYICYYLNKVVINKLINYH